MPNKPKLTYQRAPTKKPKLDKMAVSNPNTFQTEKHKPLPSKKPIKRPKLKKIQKSNPMMPTPKHIHTKSVPPNPTKQFRRNKPRKIKAPKNKNNKALPASPPKYHKRSESDSSISSPISPMLSPKKRQKRFISSGPPQRSPPSIDNRPTLRPRKSKKRKSKALPHKTSNVILPKQHYNEKKNVSEKQNADYCVIKALPSMIKNNENVNGIHFGLKSKQKNERKKSMYKRIVSMWE